VSINCLSIRAAREAEAPAACRAAHDGAPTAERVRFSRAERNTLLLIIRIKR
ncbi:hypothetical protein GY641_24810, partial [Escherichia coli]|nr:hypothetical protein [Escherichia coli]